MLGVCDVLLFLCWSSHAIDAICALSGAVFAGVSAGARLAFLGWASGAEAGIKAVGGSVACGADADPFGWALSTGGAACLCVSVGDVSSCWIPKKPHKTTDSRPPVISNGCVANGLGKGFL